MGEGAKGNDGQRTGDRRHFAVRSVLLVAMVMACFHDGPIVNGKSKQCNTWMANNQVRQRLTLW